MKTEVTIENEHLIFKLGKENCSYNLSFVEEVFTTSMQCGIQSLPFENVSKFMYHMLITRNIPLDMLLSMEQVIQTFLPNNLINWENNNFMINYIKEFREMYSELYFKDSPEKKFKSAFERMNERILIRRVIIQTLNMKYLKVDSLR